MKKTLIGTVTSNKNAKTIRVEIERRYKHPKYGKIVRGRTVCHAHDENDTANVGDLVEIVESRPLSKTKRWEFVRVVKTADLPAETADTATK
jgi:small subunit ribosomal protein S17